MFTYAQVERCLAEVHEVPMSRMGALRGRIKNMQKLGLAPSSPGKGRKVSYDLKALYVWALYLELAEFGVDPVTFGEFAKLANFSQVIDLNLLSSVSQGDLYLKFYPRFVSKWSIFQGPLLGSFGGIVVGSELAPHMFGKPMARMGVINLTYLRREVERAISYQNVAPG